MKKADITQAVEYLLGKEEVIGSNPIISSKTFIVYFTLMVLFQVFNLVDMGLTYIYIFGGDGLYSEANPLITNIYELLAVKVGSLLAGSVLFYFILTAKKTTDRLYAKAALIFGTGTYFILILWWAFLLSI